MRFVSVRELRARSADVWSRLANDRDMVVTSNGKPVAILSAVSEDSLEESLAAIRRGRAITAVEALQSASVKRGRDRMSSKDVEAEIAAARRRPR